MNGVEKKRSKRNLFFNRIIYSIYPKRLHVRFLIGCFNQSYFTTSPNINPSL